MTTKENRPKHQNDGYEWLIKFDMSYLKKVGVIRAVLKWYFLPFKIEKHGNSLIYRSLGVPVFGKYLPTGGSEIKRMTKMKMKAYSLKSLSINSVVDFLYKNSFFEFLHLPFFVFMVWRSIWWIYYFDNIRIAVELQVVNLLFNIYPIMFHRYTRIRILKLIEKSK
jgi:hypothetical protein